MDDIPGAGHSAGTAGQAFVRENEGSILGYLNGSGRAGSLAQAATDAAYLANILAAGGFVGAQNHNGIVFHSQVNDTLGTDQIAGTAADTFAFIHFGDTVGIEGDSAKSAGINAGAAAGTAVFAQVIAFGRLLGTATAITVDAGNSCREFFLNDHKNLLSA